MAIIPRTVHTVADAWTQRKRVYSDGNRNHDGRTATGRSSRCGGTTGQTTASGEWRSTYTQRLRTTLRCNAARQKGRIDRRNRLHAVTCARAQSWQTTWPDHELDRYVQCCYSWG